MVVHYLRKLFMNHSSQSQAEKKKRIQAIADFLTVLYTQADTLLGVTKWEAIPLLEESLEQMESRQYARDCLRYSEGQSTDMKARLGMLRATIDFLKARKEHFHGMTEAKKIKENEKQFDQLIDGLL